MAPNPTKRELSEAARLFAQGKPTPSFFHVAGGKARAKKLSAERKAEIGRYGSLVRTMNYVNGKRKRKGKPVGLARILEAEKEALQEADHGAA